MKPTTALPTDGVGSQTSPTNGSARAGPPTPAEAIALGPPRGARSRVPQALLAGLLIVGGGLGGLLLFNRYDQRVPAVVVVAPVAHGAELTRADLAVTEVGVERGVATVGSLSEVIGRHAAHDLEPGELIAPTDVAGAEELVTAGQSVVGLQLDPGQYPTTQIAVGDRVDIFAVGGAGTAGVGAAGAVGRRAVSSEPLVGDVAVFAVAPASSDGRTLLVSVVVAEGQAGAVHGAVDDGGVRLSLRGRE